MQTARRGFAGICGALAAMLCGCASPAPQTADRASTPVSLQPYVRIKYDSTNTIDLQVAARKFIPQKGRGPTIWLVGVSHLGEPAYFEQLQTQLNSNNVVLYEGIGAKEWSTQHRSNASPGDSQEPGGLQSSLAEVLGLEFQLTAIDYSPSNFRNSDLTLEELRQILEERSAPKGTNSAPAKSGTQDSLEGFLQTLQGQTMANVLLRLAAPFMRASPELRGMARLLLIELLGQIEGDPNKLRGLPQDTRELLNLLLEMRNQKVMADLRQERSRLKRGDSIAVFYGAAHMLDLERRICEELRYKSAQEMWLNSFGVDLQAAKLSDAQVRSLREFTRQQLQSLML